MSWDTEMTTILRVTIQDMASPPTYSDPQLQQMILVSALTLQAQISFRQPYVPDIDAGTLTPDPTGPAARDDQFINLCCLKAALMIVIAEVKGFTRQGIRIKDGESEIELRRDPKALQAMYDVYARQYEDALYAYKTGGNEGLGEIITSPYPYLAGHRRGLGGMFEGCGGPRGYRSDGFVGGLH